MFLPTTMSAASEPYRNSSPKSERTWRSPGWTVPSDARACAEQLRCASGPQAWASDGQAMMTSATASRGSAASRRCHFIATDSRGEPEAFATQRSGFFSGGRMSDESTRERRENVAADVAAEALRHLAWLADAGVREVPAPAASLEHGGAEPPVVERRDPIRGVQGANERASGPSRAPAPPPAPTPSRTSTPNSTPSSHARYA